MALCIVQHDNSAREPESCLSRRRTTSAALASTALASAALVRAASRRFRAARVTSGGSVQTSCSGGSLTAARQKLFWHKVGGKAGEHKRIRGTRWAWVPTGLAL